MTESVFQVLASEDAAEQERLSGNRAVIAVQTRVKEKFEKFVRQAKTDEEHAARIDLVLDDIAMIAVSACDTYNYDDMDRLILAGTAVLGGGHSADCTCGFCENKGKLPGQKDEDDEGEEDLTQQQKEAGQFILMELFGRPKTAFDYPNVDGSLESEQTNEFGGPIGKPLGDTTKGDNDDELGGPIGENASGKKGASVTSKWQVLASFCDCSCEGCSNGGTHCESEKCIESKRGEPEPLKNSKVAADVETGDTYAQERVDLPAADDSGLGGPSPKIDKSKVPADGLKAIDVPSEFHPTEQQAVGETTPDYAKELPGPSNTGKSVSADSPLQPEHNVAPNTDTWNGTEGQANPVTSAVDKWRIVG